MDLKLYNELTPWYRILTPVADYTDEAQAYLQAFEGAISGPRRTLLELGCGAGHNAWHLKPYFQCTLTDLAPGMLALSQELNPECEHQLGDMRTLRLGRTFDAVLVHDAIAYMTTTDDLRAVMETAFLHLRPGGAAIFAPDAYQDTFQEGCELLEGQEGSRTLKGLEWSWVPDPSRPVCMVEYNFLLRDGTTMRAVHDRHEEGLFPRQTWLELLESLGFAPTWAPRPIGDGEFDRILVARRTA